MSRKKIIKKRLSETLISIYQVAQYVALTQKELNAWIDGKSKIPYEKTWKIADLLNLNPDELLR